MSNINRENYVVIQGWMVTDLKLKGNELLIYACIFGFSQTDEQAFNGSRQYLADWTNSSKQSVTKCLKSLVDKGYIAKEDRIINGVKFCSYRATKLSGRQQSCPGVGNKVDRGATKLTGGGQQSCLPVNRDAPILKANDSLKTIASGEAKDNPNNIIYNIYTPSLSKGGVGGNLSLDGDGVDDGRRAEATHQTQAFDGEGETRTTATDAVPSVAVAPVTPTPNSAPPLPLKACDARFERFWAAYPRKVGKGAARRSFQRINPNNALVERMIAAVNKQRWTVDWTKEGGQYIPHPATWLNQERWEDEIGTAPQPSSKGGFDDDNWLV